MMRLIGMGFVTFVQRLSCSFSESVLLEFGVSTVHIANGLYHFR